MKPRDLIRMLAFPVYSLFSPKIGFTVVYPTSTGWRAYTRGRTFPIRGPHIYEFEYFRHFVPQIGDLIFDVGGELGHETAQFAELVGPSGRVFTFECLPDHVKRLKEIAGKWTNVTVVESACWNKTTTLEFSVGRTPGSGTAVPVARGQDGQELADLRLQKLKVTAETLDNLWKTHAQGKTIDFLKMDIEGAEYEALEGATELLRNTKFAAIAAYHLRDGVRTADKVARILKNAGFRTRIDENHHVYGVR